MRYAILGDIHGNLEALQAVLTACQDDGARQYYCVGDIVGYGANPNECIELIKSVGAISVAGNHDWAAIDKISPQDFNQPAQDAIRWTKTVLSEESKKFLADLPVYYKHDDFLLVHGTLHHPEEFIYLTDTNQALDTFYLMDRPVCFVGHTHRPFVMWHHPKGVFLERPGKTEINLNRKYIINVGSVGQPRDENPLAAYAIFDPDLKRVEIKRVRYDIAAAQSKIYNLCLPSILASRLAIGQ